MPTHTSPLKVASHGPTTVPNLGETFAVEVADAITGQVHFIVHYGTQRDADDAATILSVSLGWSNAITIP